MRASENLRSVNMHLAYIWAWSENRAGGALRENRRACEI